MTRVENREEYDYAKRHPHEEIGIKYLTEKLGYNREDIRGYNRSGMHDINKGIPDLLTLSDKKEWEVKTLRNLNIVTFTEFQYRKFDDDVNVLIFDNGAKHEFVDCVKFGDIKYNRGNVLKYKFLVTFEVDMCMTNSVQEVVDEHAGKMCRNTSSW